MKEIRFQHVYQARHVDIEPSNSIKVMANLEVNDVEIGLGEGFIMPYVAYQLGLEDGWWCDLYSFRFALKLVYALIVLVRYAHEGHNFNYCLCMGIVVWW
jgi:hypothetical protein